MNVFASKAIAKPKCGRHIAWVVGRGIRMNFDQYFAGRNELAMRILVEIPDVVAPRTDWRYVGLGGTCLAVAVGCQVWAALTLVDPGFFLRTSVFLQFLLLAGVCVLAVPPFADAGLARSQVRARETLKERTVANLLSADRAVASRLASRAR